MEEENEAYRMTFFPLAIPWEWNCATPLHQGHEIAAQFLCLLVVMADELIIKQASYVCPACKARLMRDAIQLW